MAQASKPPAPQASGFPDIDKWYNDAVAHTHSIYDAQLAQLGNANTSAQGGVNQYAQQTISRLGAIGQDALGQDKLSRRNVSKNYKGAQGALGGDFASLLADLQHQGADTTGLSAEYAARKASLADAGARQGTMSDRLTQILGTGLKERTQSAEQVHNAALNDLARVYEQAQSQAHQGESEALYQLQTQYNQQLMAARQAAAAAARAGGGGGGKPSLSSITSLARFLAGGKGKGGAKGQNYNSLLKYLTQGRAADPNTGAPYTPTANEMYIANEYLNQLAAPKGNKNHADANTLLHMFEDIKGSGKKNVADYWGFDPTGIENMLNAAQRMQMTAAQPSGYNPLQYLQQAMLLAGG